MFPVSTPDFVFPYRTNKNRVTLPLRTLLGAGDAVQLLPGSLSDCSDEICHKVLFGVSQELDTHSSFKINMSVKRAVPQQFDALMSAVVESEFHTSVNIARMDCIAWPEKKLTQTIEKIAPATISPLLLSVQVSVENMTFGQVRSPVRN